VKKSQNLAKVCPQFGKFWLTFKETGEILKKIENKIYLYYG